MKEEFTERHKEMRKLMRRLNKISPGLGKAIARPFKSKADQKKSMIAALETIKELTDKYILKIEHL